MASTPARSTRSRNRIDRPAVGTRFSTAYGAPNHTIGSPPPLLPPGVPFGGDVLGAGLEQARREAHEIEEAHERQTQRRASRAPSEPRPSATRPNPISRRRTRRKAAPAPPATDPEDDEADDDQLQGSGSEDELVQSAEQLQSVVVREGTAIDAAANYEGPRRDNAQSAAGNGREDELEPWRITVLIMALPRYIRRLLADTPVKTLAKFSLLLLIISSALLALFSFSLPEENRDKMVRGLRLVVGLPEYEQPPSGVERDWIFFKHEKLFRSQDLPEYNVPDLQWAININFLERIEKLEKKTNQLNETLQAIQDSLPKSIVVRNVDGELTIPDDFWRALQAKMGGDESLWTAFLDANRAALEEFESHAIKKQLEDAENTHRVISRAVFVEFMEKNNDMIQRTLTSNLRDIAGEIIGDAKAGAEEVARDLLAKHTGTRHPGSEPALLAKNNLLFNTVEELRSVNYFSQSLGARIEPRYTSPTTIVAQNDRLSTWWASFFRPPHQPHVALEKWHEMHECWCASESSDQGKAQIAVWTPDKIFPDQLFIEHIPVSGSLDIEAAPRDFEFWIKALDEENAKRVADTIAEHVPSWKYHGCGKPPGPNFVCVAWGRYDIHRDNWVQKFPIAVQPDEYGLASDTFVFRATSNWGADHTCLYRLRLTGIAIA